MFAKQYFDAKTSEEKKRIKQDILKNESSLMDDMKAVVKEYIKNNINRKTIKQAKKHFSEIENSAGFKDKQFVMNYTCLLDMKSFKKDEFDRGYMQFAEQKKQLPEIQGEILQNLKQFIESEEYVKGYFYIKNKYNIEDDKEIIKKMRDIIYNKIKKQ